MLYFLLVAGIVWGLPTIYLAYRFREYRKFLGGAFFVSWGNLLYLYFGNVSLRSWARTSSSFQRAAARAPFPISFSSGTDVAEVL